MDEEEIKKEFEKHLVKVLTIAALEFYLNWEHQIENGRKRRNN